MNSLYIYGILAAAIAWGLLGWWRNSKNKARADKEKARADAADVYNATLTDTIIESNEMRKKYAKTAKLSREQLIKKLKRNN